MQDVILSNHAKAALPAGPGGRTNKGSKQTVHSERTDESNQGTDKPLAALTMTWYKMVIFVYAYVPYIIYIGRCSYRLFGLASQRRQARACDRKEQLLQGAAAFLAICSLRARTPSRRRSSVGTVVSQDMQPSVTDWPYLRPAGPDAGMSWRPSTRLDSIMTPMIMGPVSEDYSCLA